MSLNSSRFRKKGLNSVATDSQRTSWPRFSGVPWLSWFYLGLQGLLGKCLFSHALLLPPPTQDSQTTQQGWAGKTWLSLAQPIFGRYGVRDYPMRNESRGGWVFTQRGCQRQKSEGRMRSVGDPALWGGSVRSYGGGVVSGNKKCFPNSLFNNPLEMLCRNTQGFLVLEQ